MRVILIEGLPGSGKSTTAHLLRRHIVRQGLPARWVYEHETPHPILQYPDVLAVLNGGTMREGLLEETLANWARFAGAPGPLEYAVLESAFFQMPVHAMLLMDLEPERIASHVLAVDAVLRPAYPLLVHLRHEDVGEALRTAARLRGDWFAGFFAERIAASAFGKARGLHGFEGVVTYFTAYRDLVDDLTSRLEARVLTLDASSDKSTFTARIADALALPVPKQADVPFDAAQFVGRYRATGADEVFDIVADGAHLAVRSESPAKLLPEGDGVFEIAGTPVRLTFVIGHEGVAERLICEAPLPNLPREWVRTS